MKKSASQECFVWWSLYVRAGSIQRLKERHVPPIEKALGALEFGWEIMTEEENPDLIRLVTYQNLCCDTIEELAVTVLRRAYRLSNNWNITGLRCLDREHRPYIIGSWSSDKPVHAAPALESMMFEVEPGSITDVNDGGGWIVDRPEK